MPRPFLLLQHSRMGQLRSGTLAVGGLRQSTFTPSRFLTHASSPPSASLSSEFTAVKAGAGYGNVRDRVIPTARPTRSSLYRHSREPHTCSILGAPMTYGQPYVGTDHGPALLRQAGLRSMLAALGWRVEDCPDVDIEEIVRQGPPPSSSSEAATPYTGHAKNSWIVGQGAYKLANLVQEKLAQGRFPLVLGGDHSIAMGTLSGLLRVKPDLGVLWIDAHADLNTPAISESGNMHGMPVGMLMQGVAPEQPHQWPPGCEWMHEGPRLSPDSLVYIGLRDVDPAERTLIQSLGIVAYTMHEIDRYGIGQVMEMALHHLLEKDPHRPLHISCDIDAADPVLAPATGTAVRGGLNFREFHYVAEAAALSGNLISAEIVELNPNLSNDAGADDTVELGLQVITSLMGKSII